MDQVGDERMSLAKARSYSLISEFSDRAFLLELNELTRKTHKLTA